MCELHDHCPHMPWYVLKLEHQEKLAAHDIFVIEGRLCAEFTV